LGGGRVKNWIPDLLILAGVSLLSYGAWLTYEPAGFIVAGSLTLFAGVRVAR
jgi:hypothetical protein